MRLKYTFKAIIRARYEVSDHNNLMESLASRIAVSIDNLEEWIDIPAASDRAIPEDKFQLLCDFFAISADSARNVPIHKPVNGKARNRGLKPIKQD